MNLKYKYKYIFQLRIWYLQARQWSSEATVLTRGRHHHRSRRRNANNSLTTPALAPDEQKDYGVAAGVLPRLETILIRKASDRVRLRAGAERLADATSLGA